MSSPEEYEKFYANFVRPPFAPIFTPTADEFADPIAYVAKIRSEAEPYGVIKIVPPSGFKPPFAINAETFQFSPRIQKLNEIDVIFREPAIFHQRISEFWELKYQPLGDSIVDGRHVNLYKLHILARDVGSSETVDRKKKWSTIAKKMGIRTSSKLKDLYYNIIQPFLQSFEDLANIGTQLEDVKRCKSSANEPQTMHGGRRPGRMMAGVASTRTSPRKASKQPKKDPVADVVCSSCDRGDEEDKLLLCDCGSSCHTFCCTPKLFAVPKTDWKCTKCIIDSVSKLGTTHGFYDAEEVFSLKTFKTFADNFKVEYFKNTRKEDITPEEVENEFWRILYDQSSTVSVRYGADLITSKVGSGFPRKTDDNRGTEARSKQHYANHVWNLNNLPVLKESVLSHIETGISGMMVPWVYVGMCFSTFCWHTEDHWTYSINYNHLGERKIWYGVGGEDANKFESVIRKIAPELTGHQRDIFHHMTTAVNPALLRAKGVNVHTVHQNAGEFVITFPRAYHAGYNEGFNIAEAVNFAPIDWLPFGRKCVTEYASVNRFCVFSHDELVMKMVNSCDKLGIGMSLASLEELKVMFQKEKSGRAAMKQRGVKTLVYQEFENMPDDSRCCRKCHTTVFLSALCCPHEHTVCLEHIDDICEKCPFSECTIKYRFTMQELEPLLNKLQNRTTLYFEWANDVDDTLDGKKIKPTLFWVDSMIDQARKKHFPHTKTFQRLLTCQKACQTMIEKVNQIVHGKIRTRKETRIQRADTRLGLEGVEELLVEMLSLPCDLSKSRNELENIVSKVKEWCTLVDKAIKDDADSDMLNKLRHEGEKFEIRTSQMDYLQNQIERTEWRARTSNVTNWKISEGMENEEGFLFKKRLTLEDAQRLIREAMDLSIPVDEQSVFHKIVRNAARVDNQADDLLRRKPTLEQLEGLWKDVRTEDWCSSDALDRYREELAFARRFGKEALTDVSLKKISRILDKAIKSTILSSTPAYSEMSSAQDNLIKFTLKCVNLFQPTTAYYSLFEIISYRDDLTALIEGQAVPRSSDGAKEHPYEFWEPLYDFSSIEDLENHLTTLQEQQLTLLNTLKQSNNTRPLNDTCLCASDKPNCLETLSCMICNSRYHAECVEWNHFFGELPLGCFLCLRCLRGKRPCVEDVQAAVRQCNVNSLEVSLTKNVLCKVRNLSREALDLMKTLPQMELSPIRTDLMTKTKILIENILGCEIVDFAVLKQITRVIPSVYHQMLSSQESVMTKVRDKPVRSSPLKNVFFIGKKSRKRSSCCDRPKRDRKRQKSTKSEEEVCSAEVCLKPYGQKINWIKCDVPDCGKWMHLVCAGITSETAKSLSFYECYKCRATPSDTVSIY